MLPKIHPSFLDAFWELLYRPYGATDVQWGVAMAWVTYRRAQITTPGGG